MDSCPISSHFSKSSKVLASLSEHSDKVEKIIVTLQAVVESGGRIYTCGNGGSACDAMHLAEELVARYLRTRPGIPAQHLLDVGSITCWANDENFDAIFERQVNALAEKNDALVVFSTSGNSPNIVKAIAAAKNIGARTIGILGKSGGEAAKQADLSLIVPSDVTAHIQEAHTAVLHVICDQLEQRLYPDCS
ncbi:hypothetical protein BVY02_01290 [bacterium J17]|nr:hypothetical protein BVY02_01290 [bacterium J17]